VVNSITRLPKGTSENGWALSLGKLPENLNSAYISFMMEYTGQIIQRLIGQT